MTELFIKNCVVCERQIKGLGRKYCFEHRNTRRLKQEIPYNFKGVEFTIKKENKIFNFVDKHLFKIIFVLIIGGFLIL